MSKEEKEIEKEVAISSVKDGSKRENYKKGSRYSKMRGRGKYARQKSGNDFSYWNGYPILMANAVQFPWYYIGGSKVGDLVVQSVEILHYIGTPGYCARNIDPINLQVRNLWLEMHRKYRGMGGYQEADLGIVMFSIIDVFEQIAELERIYGLLFSYPVNNRSVPRGILKAMGFNNAFIDNTSIQLADFRYAINRLIVKASRLCLPKGLPALYNRLAMAGFVYSDSQSDRAAAIAFVPRAHYQFSGTAFPTGSAALVTPGFAETAAHGTSEWTDLVALTDAAIDALINDSDVNRMCSDLLACFGVNGIDALAELPENHRVTPQYSEVILNKVHNAETFCMRSPSDTAECEVEAAGLGGTAIDTQFIETTGFRYAAPTTPDSNNHLIVPVYQSKNVITFVPYMRTNMGNSIEVPIVIDSSTPTLLCEVDDANARGEILTIGSHICDTWKDAPDDETRCDACLYKVVTRVISGSKGADSGWAQLGVSFGPELILAFEECALDKDAVKNHEFLHSYEDVGLAATIVTSGVTIMSKVDWHPYIKFELNGTINIYGDVDNITEVTYNVITKIHDAALLSAFKFPSLNGNSSGE